MHFTAVFNRQKTRTVTRSLRTRILRFHRETKLTKKQCKNDFKNSPSDQGGGAVAPSTPEYATATTAAGAHTDFDENHACLLLDNAGLRDVHVLVQAVAG